VRKIGRRVREQVKGKKKMILGMRMGTWTCMGRGREKGEGEGGGEDGEKVVEKREGEG
jgi:hypothetical protein